MKNLKVLQLGINKITKVSPKIEALTQLEKIDLSYNYKLESLPEELCRLHNLQELWLSKTALTELPNKVG